ncbi:MAG: leishmanolysin-related zinc metalloendopeptidase [Nannocystales bacterium]
MTGSRLALGLLVVSVSGCSERLIIDQSGLVIDTDDGFDSDFATDSGPSSDAEDSAESSGGGPVSTSGCVLGEPECPCPAGQVPSGGGCVEATVDAMAAVSPVDQSALAGDFIELPPAVRVTAGGAPVTGTPVTFTTAGLAGGVLGEAQAVTDADGVATAESWQLGKLDGNYFVRASVGGGALPPIDFTGRTISDFDIVLHYVNPPSDSQEAAFETARLRWQGALINALPAIQGSLSGLAQECGIPFDGGNVSVTGVHIFVQLQEIDGPGGENGNILGQAGPCSLRDDGSPYLGVMTFDTFDLAVLEDTGSLESVILHEMGHVLGVGSLWRFSGLLEDPSIPNNAGADTHFLGSRATEVFLELLGGQPFAGAVVPVENNAQQGSSDSHWRETVMDDELMSPSLGGFGTAAPLSILTIGSMGDLGFYVPNELAADAWSLPPQALVVPTDKQEASATDKVLSPRWIRTSDGTLSAL